jgi:hypothetical protein
MEEVLRFFRTYEMWIYLGLGLLALWQIRKFGIAWDEVRGALFGLERESAQARINQAATMLVLLLIMAIAEFTLVTFVVPSVPGAIPIPTSTLNLLATPSTTLPVITPAGMQPTATLAVETQVPPGEGCIPGQIAITYPADGQEIQGVVVLSGTVDIPNFGFYTYEIARPGETIWLPIQVGREIKHEAVLGNWDTTALPAGEYMLRLVVTDNQGNALEPCVIRVTVAAAPN